MTVIDTVTLDVADLAATRRCHGFTLGLTVPGPATVVLGVADVGASKRFYTGPFTDPDGFSWGTASPPSFTDPGA